MALPKTGTFDTNFNKSSFTVKIYNVIFQLEKDFDTLTDKQQHIWQGLYTFWAEESLKLIEESYGYSFSDSDATVNKITVEFHTSETLSSMASVHSHSKNGKATELSLLINVERFNDISDDDVSGKLWRGYYLDRTIAHELTHAIMRAKIDNYSKFPKFFREGMAELTHGIDDKRIALIQSLSNSPENLQKYLDLDSDDLGSQSESYAAGYMFLRYLAKQSAAEDNVINNTISAVILNGTSLNDNIFNSGDKVTIYSGKGNDTIKAIKSTENIVYGGEGNDLIFVEYGTINGGKGNDTIDGSSVTQRGRLCQYASGDGADIIIGFNSFDTLEITSGTYSTQKSGDNLIVNVGNGAITLKDIYSSENNKVHIKDAAGNIVTLNDWSIMSGTNGADSLYNVVDNVTIDAMGGNDTIENHGAKVSISGGAGNDTINNYSDNVTIDGNAGADYIYSEGEENIISGGAGNDTISGTSSTIYGGDDNYSIKSITGSNDTIDGGDGNDTIESFDSSSMNGGAGNDVIIFYTMWCNGTSTINGGTGNDTVNYSKFPSDELAAVYYGITGKNRYRAIYQYANGDGADVINRFTKYDKIEISGGSYSSVISGNDIILKVGNGSITLKDAKNIEELNIEGTFDSTSGGNTDTVKTIHNTKSDTLISGGNGNDTIISVQYDGAQVLYRNTIHGGNGNDKIRVYLSSLNAVYGDDGNDSIYADFNDDITIYGGNGNDTLVIEGANRPVVNGGRGNDLVTLRASNSLYQYASGDGNDTIYGLDSNDIVKISGGKYSTVKSGADLKVSVGGGAILLKGAANSAVKFDGTLEGGGSSNETLPAGISIKNSVLTASTKFTGNEINLADYPTATKLNASALSQAVSIVGTSANNSLKGGKGADTISGGSGNDTLAGGAGKDIFIYSRGNDLITDYKTGEDKISANYTSSSVKGSDVILTTSNGNLTVKGAKDKVVTFIDGSEKIFYADTSYAPLETGLTYDAKRTVLTASNKFAGTEINLANYLLTATKFNGANAKNALEITGNATNNSLKGGKGADTISGGSGNDTLAGGAGKDIFIYSSGNDLITDYSTEDKIKINGKISGTSYSGKNVIFTVGDGSLTVKNGKGKNISVTDSSGAQTYSKTFDLLEDNNFISDVPQISDISEKKFAVTQIQEIKVEELSQPILTFSKEK